MDFSSNPPLTHWNSSNSTFYPTSNPVFMTNNVTQCLCKTMNPNASCICPNDVISSSSKTEDMDSSTATFYPWNNPEMLMTQSTLFAIERVVTCGLNPVLLAIGLPGNVLSCLVFKRQGLRDRMNVSLFSLALVDLMVVVLWFFLGSFCLLGQALPSVPWITTWWKWTVRKYLRGFHRGFYFASGCLTMLIAVERCLCVMLPLRAANLIRTQTATTIIILTVASLHLLCLLYPFKFDVTTTYDQVLDVTVVLLPKTDAYINFQAPIDILENWVIMTIIPFVNFIVVAIVTAITVIKLQRNMAWREGIANNSGKKSQVALVKMLVIVSCIYIVTAFPNIVLGIIRSYSSDFWLTGKYRNTFVACHLLYLFMGTVNSSVNFFVYMLRSSRFRAELYSMLPACCMSKMRLVRRGSWMINSARSVTHNFATTKPTVIAGISNQMAGSKMTTDDTNGITQGE